MYCRIALASLVLAIGVPVAATDRPLTDDERVKLGAAVAAQGCSGGQMEFDDEGYFEVDDATCSDGRKYDSSSILLSNLPKRSWPIEAGSRPFLIPRYRSFAPFLRLQFAGWRAGLVYSRARNSASLAISSWIAEPDWSLRTSRAFFYPAVRAGPGKSFDMIVGRRLGSGHEDADGHANCRRCRNTRPTASPPLSALPSRLGGRDSRRCGRTFGPIILAGSPLFAGPACA